MDWFNRPCILSLSSGTACMCAYACRLVLRKAASSELSVSTAAERKGLGVCVDCLPYILKAKPRAMFCECSNV